MAEGYPSSNPFRRKTPTKPPSIPRDTPSSINHSVYLPSQSLADSSDFQNDAPKKATKKVRVQSPPPASPSTPSLPDSSSTIGEDVYAKPPTPIPRDDDPFESTTSDASEDEAVSKPSRAPMNPFSKTLETMEHPERDTSATISSTNVMSPARASMDVEAFKRLLMTGNSGLGISTPPVVSPAHVHHGLGDGGSSTDTSSISRQSIFEPIQETHPESPRTSHEISEPDEDRRGNATDLPHPTGARKKPPPPSSRHGKLIRVELRDDHSQSSIAVLGPPQSPTPGSINSPQSFTFSSQTRSNTDLNKPLPPAPNRASHELERESVFDKEAAGKTPEPPSPSASIRRKTPPAPPLTRRHSQLVSESKNSRETGRLSPKTEEEGGGLFPGHTGSRPDLSRSRSDAKPQPPPSRRPASIRHSSHQNLNPMASPSSISLPPPTPPARGSSRSISGRPPSVVSLDMSSKRMPPPPPPRHGRGSMDGGEVRTSGDLGRRSVEIARKGSGGSVFEEDVKGFDSTGSQDILAEMSRLQRDIDLLRIQSERDGSS